VNSDDYEDAILVSCKRYLFASWLYEKQNKSFMSDQAYDSLCKFLYIAYESLPCEFQTRVSSEQLKAGTGLGIELDEIEIQEALQEIEG